MNAKVQVLWKQWSERIDERSLRERALLFLAVMAAIYVAASSLVFAPLHKEQVRLEQQLNDKRAEIQVFDSKIQGFVAQAGQGEQDQRARLTALQAQLRGLDSAAGQMSKRLVPPKEMARLIEEVLRSHRELQLLKIESLPANPLNDKLANKELGTSGTIYRHGMRIQFRGGYGDIVSYLRALENLPWRMYWGEISLVTDQYPQSTVSLTLYTLSLDEAWIGV